MKCFINTSIILGTNKIDWLRTIYFSLFGSATLTFFMKFKSFDPSPKFFFILGIVLFLLGLIAAMRISDSFKLYEKEYPTFSDSIKLGYSNNINFYILEKENENYKGLHHFAIYFFFFLAMASIGFSGFKTESKSIESSKSLKEELEQIDHSIIEFKEEKELINSLILEKDQFVKLNNRNIRLIDSLTQVNKHLNDLNYKREKQ